MGSFQIRQLTGCADIDEGSVVTNPSNDASKEERCYGIADEVCDASDSGFLRTGAFYSLEVERQVEDVAKMSVLGYVGKL